MGEDDLDGLLVVGAYRADDVDAAHPLTAMLSRWRRQPGRPGASGVGEPAAAEPRGDGRRHAALDAEIAAELARAIAPHTNGNPYETVELLNALMRRGILVPGRTAGSGTASSAGRVSGRGKVVDMLAERFDVLPPSSRDLLEAMACLGGRAELSLLQTATGDVGGRAGCSACARAR